MFMMAFLDFLPLDVHRLLHLLLLAALLPIPFARVGLAATGRQEFARVDAGGHKLRAWMTGRGSPTVVFESGADGPLDAWVRVQPEVSKFTSTFSYDRAGFGLSPRGPTPRDGRQVATELHAALHNANVTPPYILVGHSLGGPFIRVFAGMYSNEVAGMVLVDPTQGELIEWVKVREGKPEAQRKMRPYDEVDCAPLTFAEAKDSRIPAGVPVALIAGMGPRQVPGFLPPEFKAEVQKDQTIYYPAKLRFYKEWLDQIPGSQLIIAENSGHGIPFEEPDLIINTIRQVVEQVRKVR